MKQFGWQVPCPRCRNRKGTVTESTAMLCTNTEQPTQLQQPRCHDNCV